MVVFDCDGVLVDSEPVSNQVTVDALAAMGIHMSLEEITGMFVGKSMTQVAEGVRAMGAQRAGMACFGYAPEGGEGLAEVGAQVSRSMHELPALLEIAR